VLGVMAWLTRRTERRQKTFADQLSDNLLLLSGNLRVGHGVLQSLDGLAREADWPSDEEFRRVVTEQRLGRDLNESFRAVVDRVGSEDLRWVAEAIEIHREVGGDLAEVLDKVAATIRDRDSVRRTIAVLTAEGRFSAYVLTALPFAGFLFITLINPEYGDLLTGTTAGHVALISAGGLMLVGWLWLRRLIRLVF
jgi:tight adherence protein B